MPDGRYNIFALSTDSTVGLSTSSVVGVSTTSVVGLSSTTPAFTSPVAPSSSNILAGSAGSNGATIITIPAGRVWYGTLSVGASASSIPGSTAVNYQSYITTGGSATPASGTILAYVALSVPSSTGATTIDGTAASGSISVPGVYVVASTSGTATLLNNTAASITDLGLATGILL